MMMTISTPLSVFDGRHADLASDESLRQENAALRRLLAVHRGLIERLPLALYVYQLEERDDDHTLRMLVANQTAAEMTGAVDVLGRTLDENFPLLRTQGVPQAYAGVVRSGEPLRFESVSYGDDRVIRSAFEVQAVPLPDDCVGVMFENLTERRRTEAELERQSGHMKQLLLHAPIALLGLGPCGVIELAEGQVEELFERPAAELPGTKIGALLGQDAGATSALRGASEGIASSVIVAVGHRYVELTFAPVREADEAVHSAVVVCTDVSDRIAAQELERARFELEQQREMRELGAPVLPLAPGLIVMPLIGRIDEVRGEQIVASLLAGLAEQRAHTAIVDVTGLHPLDAQAAETLQAAARAATLAGAGFMLTGVDPGVNSTLAALGVDLVVLRAMNSLQDAIAAALRERPWLCKGADGQAPPR